jgi:SPP1 family predicted phage head-tail adaptor
MNVDASKFDRYIGLFAPSQTTASGEVTRTYALSKSVWAHIDTRAQNESFIEDKRNAKTSIVVNIRQDSSVAIDALWQIEVDGLRYQVSSITENTNFARGEVWRIVGDSIL